jgi:hypothetical protein
MDPRRGLPTSRTRPTFIKQKLETNLQRNDDQEKQVKLSLFDRRLATIHSLNEAIFMKLSLGKIIFGIWFIRSPIKLHFLMKLLFMTLKNLRYS